MESLGHAWHTEGSRRALLGHPSRLQVREATPAPIRREASDHRGGDLEAASGQVHQGGILS